MKKFLDLFKVKEIARYVLVIILGLAAAQGALLLNERFRMKYSEGNFVPYLEHYGKANQEGRPVVVMFGTSWCPYCSDARKYFKEHNITISDVDVEKDPTALRDFTQLGRGSYPLVLIGNRAITGFHPEEYRDALGAAAK